MKDPATIDFADAASMLARLLKRQRKLDAQIVELRNTIKDAL